MANTMGWGTDVVRDDNLRQHPHHYEAVKWSYVSGGVACELEIVADYHYVPEWGAQEWHLNVRTYGGIQKREYPYPSTLTKRHYRLDEFGLIHTELFSLKNKTD